MNTTTNSIETHHISVPRTARLATCGSITPNTKAVWIACHGYGEIASEFMASMTSIVNSSTFIIAPEALSRFYWGGNFDGKPVASWMTREDRLNEIKDYSNYLNIVLADINQKVPVDTRIILFGFSQGCATVMRYAQALEPAIDAMVIWSGMIPEDIDYNLEYFERIKCYCRYGDQDRFITPERADKHQMLVAEKGLSFDTKSFEGKHKVYAKPLLELRNQVYLDLGL